MKNKLIIFALLSFMFGCSNKMFNSEKWKTNTEEQIYMINDIVENKRLIGKTKNEIINLLDTFTIKQYNYSDNYWMFIVSTPYPVPATKTVVKAMDIEFENEVVKQVTIRE